MILADRLSEKIEYNKLTFTERDMHNTTNQFSTATTQKNLSFKNLAVTAIRHWLILLPIVAVCALLAFAHSVLMVTPLYNSTAKLYIINKN